MSRHRRNDPMGAESHVEIWAMALAAGEVVIGKVSHRDELCGAVQCRLGSTAQSPPNETRPAAARRLVSPSSMGLFRRWISPIPCTRNRSSKDCPPLSAPVIVHDSEAWLSGLVAWLSRLACGLGGHPIFSLMRADALKRPNLPTSTGKAFCLEIFLWWSLGSCDVAP